MTALALLHHRQAPASDLHVLEPQPSTSQRRSPASSIPSTMARSLPVRSAPSSRSASAGARIFGRVRGTRSSGTVRDYRDPP